MRNIKILNVKLDFDLFYEWIKLLNLKNGEYSEKIREYIKLDINYNNNNNNNNIIIINNKIKELEEQKKELDTKLLLLKLNKDKTEKLIKEQNKESRVIYRKPEDWQEQLRVSRLRGVYRK